MTAAEDAAKHRDGPVCLRCGTTLHGRSASKHHRKLKGRGTPKRLWDLVENIVILCGSGTTGCHGWAHHHRREAEATGWIVPSWADPAEVPLIDLLARRFWLRPDGTNSLYDDPWATAHGNTEQGA